MFRRRSRALIFAADHDTVARPNELLVADWRDTCLMGDLDGGVDRMRFRGRVWLPQEHLETDEQYNARVARSHLYPGVTSALDEVGAQPFSKPVEVENLPPELEALVQNVDGDGNDLTQFSKSFMRSACKYGRAHAFIDYTQVQPSNGRTLSKADEQSAAPRPYWRIIEKPALLGWRTFTLPSGQTAFSEIRIHEIRTEPDGQFGERKAEYVRVIGLNSQQLWRNKAYNPQARSARLDNAANRDFSAQFYDHVESRMQDWELVSSGPFGPEGGWDQLPFVTVYTGYLGFMKARSPFAKLAETNLTHWQSSSDQRNIVHVARVPILFGRGFQSEEMRGGVAIGSGTAVFSQGPGANLAYVEHSGAAVSVGQEDLDRLQSDMEQMGVRPHVEKSSGASATGVFSNAEGAATDIQAWAQATDTGIEQCFGYSARWMGLTLPEDFDVQIFKDYAVKVNGAQDVQSLIALYDKGLLDPETLLKEVKRRGLLSDDADMETLLAYIEQEKARKAEVAAQIAGNMNANPGEGATPKPGGEDEHNPDGKGAMPMPPNQREAEE